MRPQRGEEVSFHPKVHVRSSVTCNMTMRFATLCLALGLLSQGCTVQKRSHLPGWHVERAKQHVGHRAAAMSSEEPQVSDAVMILEAEPDEEVLAVAVAPMPLPSLEAFVPEDIGAAEPKLRKLDFRSASHESPHVNDVVAEEEVEPASKNSGGMGRALWRVLLGVIAAGLGAYGIRVVQMGLGWWDGMSGNPQYNPDGDVTLFLLGVVLLEVAWRALLVAFPKLRAWEPSWSDLKRDPQAREARREAGSRNTSRPLKSAEVFLGGFSWACLPSRSPSAAFLPLPWLLVGVCITSRCRSRCSGWG